MMRWTCWNRQQFCVLMAEAAASPVLIAVTPGENVFQVERWAKLTKAIRVVA